MVPLRGQAEVSTPDQLAAAVANGIPDILVTNHMDLSGLELKKTPICPDGCESPVGPINGTRSIRVRNPGSYIYFQ